MAAIALFAAIFILISSKTFDLFFLPTFDLK